jgi:hypothetical protein
LVSRLADEYDVAQADELVGKGGARTDLVPDGNEVLILLNCWLSNWHPARLAIEADAGLVINCVI